MATQLGPKLTAALIRKINSESRRDSNEVVFLNSVDVEGYPNTALLGFAELFVKSTKIILFAVGEDSSSKKNLLRTKKGSLVFWGGKKSGIYYVKGRTKMLKRKMKSSVEGLNCSALILHVEKVSKDYSSIAQLLSTVTYDNKQVISEHGVIQKELQSLGDS